MHVFVDACTHIHTYIYVYIHIYLQMEVGKEGLKESDPGGRVRVLSHTCATFSYQLKEYTNHLTFFV